MKILSTGKDEPKTKRKTCGKCRTKMEYDNSDIKTDRDGSYIVCPTCKSFITVPFIV